MFPDPEAFRPERWLGDEKSTIHPMAVRQFSKGPRMCIGMVECRIKSNVLINVSFP